MYGQEQRNQVFLNRSNHASLTAVAEKNKTKQNDH